MAKKSSAPDCPRLAAVDLGSNGSRVVIGELNGTAAANLGQCPSSDTIPIELVALSLASTSPLTVTYGGASPEAWKVVGGTADAVRDTPPVPLQPVEVSA